MTYNLNWSDTPALKPVLTVNDQQIITPTGVTGPTGATGPGVTSIEVDGASSLNWGEGFNENTIKLLEHFASSNVIPPYPTIGQLWFNVASKTLMLYYSGSWHELDVSSDIRIYGPTPTYDPPVPGDLWYDTVNNLLMVYTIDGYWIAICMLIPGQHGPMGPQGVLGLRGPTGPTGWTGPNGFSWTGSQGVLNFVTGGIGPVGPTGPTGDLGGQGPQGAPGSSGNPGSQGPDGGQGNPGSNGNQGPPGTTGSYLSYVATGYSAIIGGGGDPGAVTVTFADIASYGLPFELNRYKVVYTPDYYWYYPAYGVLDQSYANVRNFVNHWNASTTTVSATVSWVGSPPYNLWPNQLTGTLYRLNT